MKLSAISENCISVIVTVWKKPKDQMQDAFSFRLFEKRFSTDLFTQICILPHIHLILTVFSHLTHRFLKLNLVLNNSTTSNGSKYFAPKNYSNCPIRVFVVCISTGSKKEVHSNKSWICKTSKNFFIVKFEASKRLGSQVESLYDSASRKGS